MSAFEIPPTPLLVAHVSSVSFWLTPHCADVIFERLLDSAIQTPSLPTSKAMHIGLLNKHYGERLKNQYHCSMFIAVLPLKTAVR